MGRHSFYILALAWLILSGCGAKEARQVARLTLTQVNTYEGLLDQKINVEKTYTSQTASDLNNSLATGRFSTELAMVGGAALDFQADAMNLKHEIQAKDLKNSFMKTFQDIRELRDQYAKASLDYREMLIASQGALELQRGPLKQVRSGLEQLQSDAKARQVLQEWIAFGITTKQKFDQLKP